MFLYGRIVIDQAFSNVIIDKSCGASNVEYISELYIGSTTQVDNPVNLRLFEHFTSENTNLNSIPERNALNLEVFCFSQDYLQNLSELI